MRLIYLVGSNHTYQFGARLFCDVSENALSEYRSFLQESIERYKIVEIAEEMNIEALKKHFVNENSVAFNLAQKLGLAHCHCEKVRGTNSKTTDEQREKYWIEQLETFNSFPAIFILGSNHVASFKKLLETSGFQPIVLVDEWKPSFNN
jgi:hypothetical protein